MTRIENSTAATFPELLIESFYRLLRKAIYPVKLMNDQIEAELIRNISPDNAFTSKLLLQAIYLFEYIIGAFLSYYLVVEPLISFFLPAFIVSSLSSGIMLAHFIKVNEWRSGRLENFYICAANREWRENWNLRAEHPNKVTRAEKVPNESPLSVAWYKAIDYRNDPETIEKNLKDILDRLQVQYAMNSKIFFTPEMQQSYTIYESGMDGFYGDLTTAQIKKLESKIQHQDLLCAVMLGFMRIPVYVEYMGVKHYFDLLVLLKSLTIQNRNPINREVIKLLSEIKFDPKVFIRTKTLISEAQIESAKVWAEAAANNNFEPALEYLKQNTIKPAGSKGLLDWGLVVDLALKRYRSRTDGFYGELVPKHRVDRIEQDPKNKLHTCGLTQQIMHNPVYILDGKGQRHYYDLLPLLHRLSTNATLIGVKNADGTPKEITLNDIIYDQEKRDVIVVDLSEQIRSASPFEPVVYSPRASAKPLATLAAAPATNSTQAVTTVGRGLTRRRSTSG
jgi:hypothetical protein